MTTPTRGDIWLVNLSPTLGREQSGERPALVLSTDAFNRGPADLIVVVPLTSRSHRVPIPWHVAVDPPEGGLRVRSYVKCEDIRSISASQRLKSWWGRVSPRTLTEVEDRLRILLDL